ncbi:uncharacterized protein LOC117119791 [Anneissia japonica]|uniref:uncharacterized protein LOC117119791 n=1 Tax=Anneissia japonica TaxID=1529436 RepID=UPI0014258561|nr:uncharacterized protein LOC117119791 [Anneissia japonica]
MPGRRSLRNLFHKKSHKKKQTIQLVPAPVSQQEIKEELSFWRRILGCCFPFASKRQAAPPQTHPASPSTSNSIPSPQEETTQEETTQEETTQEDSVPVTEPTKRGNKRKRESKSKKVEPPPTLLVGPPAGPPALALRRLRKEEEKLGLNLPHVTELETEEEEEVAELSVDTPTTEDLVITGETIPAPDDFPEVYSTTNSFDEEDEDANLQADIDEILKIVPPALGSRLAPCRRFSTKRVFKSPSTEESEAEEDLFGERSPSIDSLLSACNSIMAVTPTETKTEQDKPTPPKKQSFSSLSSSDSDDFNTDPNKFLKHTIKRPFSPELTRSEIQRLRLQKMTPWERLNEVLPPFTKTVTGEVTPFIGTCYTDTPQYYVKTFNSTVFAGHLSGELSNQSLIFKGGRSNQSGRKLMIQARVMELFKDNDKFPCIYGLLKGMCVSTHRLGDFALVMEFVGKQENFKSYTLEDVCITRKFVMGFSRISAIRMGVDTTIAVNTMHRAGLLHCNLTPKSVLIDTRDTRYKTKIFKFGNVCLIDAPIGLNLKNDQAKTDPFNILNDDRDDYAPELYHQALPSIKSDVYGLGKILHVLGSFSYVAALKKIGEKCMSRNPEDRPDLQEILAEMETILTGKPAPKGGRGHASGPGPKS